MDEPDRAAKTSIAAEARRPTSDMKNRSAFARKNLTISFLSTQYDSSKPHHIVVVCVSYA